MRITPQHYESTRGLAEICSTSPATIARLAAELRVGSPGMHRNSPRAFTLAEGAKIQAAYFAEQKGAHRNAMMAADAEILKNAERMAWLAGLAKGMQHPAWQELSQLGAVVAQIRKGTGPKTDITSLDGKTRFLASLNPHRSALDAALRAVSAKL